MTLDPTYRRFLELCSSEIATTEPLPRLLPGLSSHIRPMESEIAKRECDRAIWGVRRILGRASFDAFHADLDSQFWHPDFMRHGYVVALSKDGDPIVQASAGKHAGTVFMTDHNFYFSWVEQLVDGEDLDELEEELEAIGFTSWSDMSADQFFDLMTIDSEMDGLFITLAPSFFDFYADCCRNYGTR